MCLDCFSLRLDRAGEEEADEIVDLEGVYEEYELDDRDLEYDDRLDILLRDLLLEELGDVL